jgi:hypothetical protein
MNKPMLEDKDKVAKVYNSKGEVCETFSFRDHGNSYLSAAQNYLMQNYDKLMSESNDYFRRRKAEEDRIADKRDKHGVKLPPLRNPKQTDYEKMRKERKEQGLDEEVEQMDEGIKEKIGGMLRRRSGLTLGQTRRDYASGKLADAERAGNLRNANRYQQWIDKDRERYGIHTPPTGLKKEDLDEEVEQMNEAERKSKEAPVTKQVDVSHPDVHKALEDHLGGRFEHFDGIGHHHEVIGRDGKRKSAINVRAVHSYTHKDLGMRPEDMDDTSESYVVKIVNQGGGKYTVIHHMKEEVEQMDEVSGSRLGKYIVAAREKEKEQKKKGQEFVQKMKDAGMKGFGAPLYRKSYGKASRENMIKLAVNKLTNPDFPVSNRVKVPATEEVEQMDEISQDLALRAHAKANDVTSRRWNDKFAGADLADKGSQGMFHHSSSGEEAADRTAKRLRERIGRKFGPEAEARAKRSEFGVVAPANTTPKKKSFLNRLGLTKEEVEQVNEKLTKDMSAGEIISDFIHSDDPKFDGKSKDERKRMALGAYYSMHPEKSKNESIKNTMYNNMLTKLEEGRGRGRPAKPGSKAWKRQQAALAQGKTIDEVPALGFQLLKHKDQGERGSGMIKFKDGSSHKISAHHRDKALRFMSSLLGAGKDPVARQEKIKNMSKSHDEFLQHIGEKPMRGPEKRHPMSAIPKEDPADEKRK